MVSLNKSYIKAILHCPSKFGSGPGGGLATALVGDTPKVMKCSIYYIVTLSGLNCIFACMYAAEVWAIF